MSLGNTICGTWHKFELFASAMDFDGRTGIAVKVGNLGRAQKRHETALTTASTRIDSLSEEIAALSEQIRKSLGTSG